MIELLEFIFASGWRFAGTVVLIIAIGFALGCFRPVRITVTHGEG